MYLFKPHNRRTTGKVLSSSLYKEEIKRRPADVEGYNEHQLTNPKFAPRIQASPLLLQPGPFLWAVSPRCEYAEEVAASYVTGSGVLSFRAEPNRKAAEIGALASGADHLLLSTPAHSCSLV